MQTAATRRIGNSAQVTVYCDVVLPPLASAQNAFGFNVGAYTSDREPLKDFRLRRIGGAETLEPEFPSNWKEIQTPATYGGVIDFHFGHFMLETLARQWWLRRVSSGHIVWQKQIPHDLMPWQVEIFSLCGIDVGRFLFVTEPIRVAELSIAEAGMVIDISYLPLWADAIGVFPFQAPTPGKKIWMSRAKMPEDFGHVSQEGEIEEKLVALGWKLVSPHLMTNTELLYFMADAETISGFAGSAYFLLLLTRNCRAKIRMVDRGGMGIPPVFEDYAVAKNLDQIIMRPKLTHVSGEGAKGTFKLESISDVVEFVNS